MRPLVVALAVIAALPAAAAAAAPDDVDDDPRRTRLAAPLVRPCEDDDPKLSCGAGPAAVRRPFWATGHAVPRFKVAYRWLTARALTGGELQFHALSLGFYPASMRFLRVGVDAELGYAGGPYSQWYFTVGPTLGFQYPARVTPFVDARFSAGLAGGSDLGFIAVSYMYTGGLEAGVELYVAGRFYLTAALGWAHPVYSGIDLTALMLNPMLQPPRKEFSDDTFTFKVGFGL
jgi:hypothetical protein